MSSRSAGRHPKAVIVFSVFILIVIISGVLPSNQSTQDKNALLKNAPQSSAITGQAGIISGNQYISYDIDLANSWNKQPSTGISYGNTLWDSTASNTYRQNGLFPTYSTYQVALNPSVTGYLSGDGCSLNSGSYPGPIMYVGTGCGDHAIIWNMEFLSALPTSATSVVDSRRFVNGGSMYIQRWFHGTTIANTDAAVDYSDALRSGLYSGIVYEANPIEHYTWNAPSNPYYSMKMTSGTTPAAGSTSLSNSYSNVGYSQLDGANANYQQATLVLSNYGDTTSCLTYNIHMHAGYSYYAWAQEVSASWTSTMARTFSLEQLMDTNLNVPSGWSVSSVSLSYSGLYLPSGVNLQVQSTPTSGYDTNIGGYTAYTTSSNTVIIPVTSVQGTGVNSHLPLRVYGNEYGGASSSGTFSSAANAWLWTNLAYINSISLHVQIKKSFSLPLAYTSNPTMMTLPSSPSGSITFTPTNMNTVYTAQVTLNHPALLTGSNWVLSSVSYDGISFDMGAVEGCIRGFIPNNLTIGSGTYSNFISAPSAISGNYYLDPSNILFYLMRSTYSTPNLASFMTTNFMSPSTDKVATFTFKEYFAFMNSIAFSIATNRFLQVPSPIYQSVTPTTTFTYGDYYKLTLTLNPNLYSGGYIDSYSHLKISIQIGSYLRIFNTASGDGISTDTSSLNVFTIYDKITTPQRGINDITIKIYVLASDTINYIHLNTFRIINGMNADYYAITNLNIPSPYPSDPANYLQWQVYVGGGTSSPIRDILFGAITYHSYSPKTVLASSWVKGGGSFPSGFSIDSVTYLNNVLYHANEQGTAASYEIQVHITSPISQTLTGTFQIISPNDPTLCVYSYNVLNQPLNPGSGNTCTININLDNSARIGNIPLENAPYFFRLTFSLGGAGSYWIESHPSTLPTIDNSMVFMGITGINMMTAWNVDTGQFNINDVLGNLVMYDFQYIDDTSTTGTFTTILHSRTIVDLFAMVAIGSTGSTCSTYDSSHSRAFCFQKMLNQNSPSIVLDSTNPTINNPVNYRSTGSSSAVFGSTITDPDGDLTTVQYALGNTSQSNVIGWTTLTGSSNRYIVTLDLLNLFNSIKLHPNLYRDSSGATVQLISRPGYSSYLLSIKATDSYAHVTTTTTAFGIYSDKPFDDRTSFNLVTKTSTYNYLAYTTGNPPQFMRYDLVGINCRIYDLDADLSTITATVRIVSNFYYPAESTNYYNSATFALQLISYDPVSRSYSFRNATSLDFLSLPTGGSYHFEIAANDAFNTVIDSFNFICNIYSPMMLEGYPMSSRPTNTFNIYESPAVNAHVLDLDLDVNFVRMNVTGTGFNLPNFIPTWSIVTSGSTKYYDISYTFTSMAWTAGNYKIYFIVKDAFGNQLVSYLTLTIFTSPPTDLVVDSPLPSVSTAYNIYNPLIVSFSVTDLDLDLNTANARFELYNSTGSIYNSTWILATYTGMVGSRFYFSTSYTIPIQMKLGDYSIIVKVVDAKGNVLYSTPFTFTLTSSIPSILKQDIKPIQGSSIPYNHPTPINATVTTADNNLASVFYQIKNETGIGTGTFLDAPTQMFNTTNTFFYATFPYSFTVFNYNSTVTLFIYGIDKMGHNASQSIYLFIRVYAPFITNVRPNIAGYPNDVFTTRAPISVNCSVGDLDHDLSSVTFMVKEFVITGEPYMSPVYTMAYFPHPITPYWYYTLNQLTLPHVTNHALYQVIINATDSKGHLTTVGDHYFEMNNHPPAITLTTPMADSIFYYNQQFSIEASVTSLDNNMIGGSVSYTITNNLITLASNVAMFNSFGDTWTATYIPTINATHGPYYLYINATDYAKLSTIASRRIYIYNYAPSVASITPNPATTTLNYQNKTLFTVLLNSDPDNDIASVKMNTMERGVSTNVSLVKQIANPLSWQYTFDFKNHKTNETLAITFYITDKYPHVVVTVLYFSIIMYAPIIHQIISPVNETTWHTNNNMIIRANITDHDLDLVGKGTVWSFLSTGSFNFANTTMLYDVATRTWYKTVALNVLFVATWQLHVYAKDGAGNVVVNNTIQINVVNTPPVIIIKTPTNGGELKANFNIVANITDQDGLSDIQYAWYRFNSLPVHFLQYKNTTLWATLINIFGFTWGTYHLTVYANDSYSNQVSLTIDIDLHPPETITVTENDISYQTDGVTASAGNGDTIQATILITHSTFLRSLDCRVNLPNTWSDVVLTATDSPYIRRGQKSYYDTNLNNLTYFIFQRFDSFQQYDEIYFLVKTPTITDEGISTGQNGESYFNFQMTTHRYYSNISVSDVSIPITSPVSAYQFKLEIQIGIDWIDVTSNSTWGFMVTGVYSAEASFTITEIHPADQIKFRIVKIVIPTNSIDTTPFFYGAMLGGGIGGLTAVVLFALKKKFEWENEGITSNKALGIISVAIIAVLFLVGVFAF